MDTISGFKISLIFLFLLVSVSFSDDGNPNQDILLSIGGFAQHCPNQNYQIIDNSGIVETKMASTFALGIGFEKENAYRSMAFRSEFFLAFPSAYYFQNWDGSVRKSYGRVSHGNPQGYFGSLLTISGNLVHYFTNKTPSYIIGGLSIKKYGKGEMASDVEKALFGNSKLRLACRFGFGMKISDKSRIEINDFISYNNFLFSLPDETKVTKPKYFIHDMFIVFSFAF